MTKAPELETTRESALKESHQRLGVTWSEQDGCLIPNSYGDPNVEYRTVRNGPCGIIDISSRGRVLVSGSEATLFLNGLITNDMKTLDSGHWMPAVFPNVQGRLIASVRVARLADATLNGKSSPIFLIDTEPATHKQVLGLIGRFTLAGDFRVSDVTANTAMLTVQGPLAAASMETVLGSELKGFIRDGVLQMNWNEVALTIIHSTHTGEDGFDILVENTDAPVVWDSFLDAGVAPVGYEVLEILRIEAGIARYGLDMDDSNVVTETNLDDAISYTKGCYIGQEIIVRIKHRGHVAKKLSGLIYEGRDPIAQGSALHSKEGREIGRVTSSTHSPALGKNIALGYVRYEHAKPDEVLMGAEAEVKVHALPFVQGSWTDEDQ